MLICALRHLTKLIDLPFIMAFSNDFEIHSSLDNLFLSGALIVSILASPVILAMNLLHLPKIYSLFAG